jgi:hypothetical protein
MLSKRSQGVILFRDFSFRLAEAYVNGAISTEEYQALLKAGFAKSCALVENELKENPTLSSTELPAFPSSAGSTDQQDATKTEDSAPKPEAK